MANRMWKELTQTTNKERNHKPRPSPHQLVEVIDSAEAKESNEDARSGGGWSVVIKYPSHD